MSKILKSPLFLIPLCAGVLLPAAAMLILRFSRSPKPQQSELKFADAVVLSGQPLPQTDLLKLNGEKISPEVLRKGKVLLVFLTTHCQPCQKEFRLLSAAETKTSTRVKIYGVGVEDKTLITDFLRDNSVTTDIVLDQHAQLMKSLSIKYFPTSLLIEDGIITKTWFGNDASEDDLFRHLGL